MIAKNLWPAQRLCVAGRAPLGIRILTAAAMLGVLMAGTIVAEPVVHEETIRIEGPLKGMKLGLRHARRANESAGAEVVLILPGAAVPVSGNQDYPFVPGRSMMTALAERGLDVWGLDYYGFGESDKYPEMDKPAQQHAALGNAEECADMVDSAVAFLKRERRVDRVMLLGDSGGTLVAGVFAARRPESVSRLVLFGPVTPFTGGPSLGEKLPAYSLFTPLDLWSLFTRWSEAAGTPNVLDPNAYQAWAETYLRSDPTSGSRTPPSVRVPNGRQADLAAVAAGRFSYNPDDIRAPTLIVMGEWDEISKFQGAQWLLHSLRQAAVRRLVVIGHGSHTIQFEIEREQLYRVMADFLTEQSPRR